METRPTNLPVQRTGFVGRAKEVAAAKELLLREDVRLVTVTGPGGIGKTRLAVQVAKRLVDHFPGGTHFVSLSSVRDPGLIALARRLAIRLYWMWRKGWDYEQVKKFGSHAGPPGNRHGVQ
jgi:hypothetical protein